MTARRVLVVLALLASALLLAVILRSIAGRASVRAAPLPLVTIADSARPESCLVCHSDVEGLGSAHAPERIGCSSCHLGNPEARDEQGAHRGLLLLTGELATAARTCGQLGCHPSEMARVSSSLMAGSPGLLAIDRFAFGERSEPRVTPEDDLRTLVAKSRSPAEDHARKLCGSCHLASPKTARGDQGFFARGGGCTACHLGQPSGELRGHGPLHPGIDADVSERRCEGCHARSARISLSYRGIAEVEERAATRRLPDGRPASDAPPDVHARAGLTCIDCHTERDVMGDGLSHEYARQAVEIRCSTCHAEAFGERPSAPDAARAADVLRRSWAARRLPSLQGRSPIITEVGTPLFRTDTRSRTLLLATTGASRPLLEATSNAYHALLGHERLACQACHSAWVPRCRSCHTGLDVSGSQVDHLLQAATRGAWLERAGENGYGAPALGVGSEGRIEPFTEGMRIRIEGVPKPVERELWAPIDPHTTGRARPCESCHPGSSQTYPASGETTRIGARLLSSAERDRVARVAECFPCHAHYDDPVWNNFARSRARLAKGTRASTADPVRRCSLVTRRY